MPLDRGRLAAQLIVLALGQGMLLYGLRWLFRQQEPGREKKDQAIAAGRKLMRRMKRDQELSEYENLVAADVVDPSDLRVGFADVGGLERTVQMLREEIVLPFSRPDIFQQASASRLLKPPKGVLMFGPPGCGKTLLAKALAKETGCCFINLRPSTFMDKWYGESQKLVEAVFSLAEKLEPSLIFIDEVDAFLRERSSSDNESSAMIKAQFMALWDGFATNPTCRVVVVAATNRAQDVDRAILRRLTRTCHVGLPDESQRHSILSVILRDENVNANVNIGRLAVETEGFSGSDLHELCRNAAMNAMRSSLAGIKASNGDAVPQIRALQAGDFAAAMSVTTSAMSEHTASQEEGYLSDMD